MLKEAKRLVDEFYIIVDEFNRTGDPDVVLKFDALQVSVELPDGTRGVVFGGWDLNTLVVTWIATLEKVRHDKSIFEPMTVRFNWNWQVEDEEGREELKMKHEVTFEPSRENAVGRHFGYTPEALAVQRARLPANLRGLHRIAFIDKNSEWHRVQIDVDAQTIVIEHPGTKDMIFVDLKGSGFRICTDDRSRERGSY
jgi:hypothetical protein